MHRRILFYSFPNWLYYFCNLPRLFCYWLYCNIKHKKFFTYKERIRVVNEIRNTCRNYGDKSKNGRWNIVCKYKFRKRSISVIVRIDKQAVDNFYDKFKKQVENFTYPCTKNIYRNGYARFEVLIDTSPVLQYDADNRSVSIGATHLGMYKWEFAEYPHGLVVGETGQGKSTFVRYLINSLLSANIPIWMIDGKMVDYNNCYKVFERYYAYNGVNVDDILNAVKRYRIAMYERLKEMQLKGMINYTENAEWKPIFLIFDEQQMFSDSLDKKTKQAFFDDLGVVLRLGRAVGFFYVAVTQTAHADSFPTTLRDNCQLKIVLGKASNTAYQMCFGSSDIMPLKKGQAWFSLGTDLFVVSIPDCKAIESEYLMAKNDKSKAEDKTIA